MKTLSGKAQALSGLLLYRVSSGSVDNEYFASILQQMYRDKIKNIHIDPGALNNSLAEVDLDKLVKKKRFKRKSDEFQRILQQYVIQNGQSSYETVVTLGDIVTWWADLTNQNKEEFMVRINTKITALVAEQSVIAVLQNPGNDQTGAAYKFGQDLLLILLSETSAYKKAALVEHLKEMILNVGPISEIELPAEILTLSCRMKIGDTVPIIEEAFSVNPAAKISLQKPLFGAVIEVMANEYGWESGVPDDNNAKLMTELKGKGLFFNNRLYSRALKKLTRRNVLLNIDSALDGTLINDLAKIILDQRTNQQYQTKSEFVYQPISSEVDAETKSKIRELLFKRRNENGKPYRNY